MTWGILPEDQKDVYRARAEARRRESWARYEQGIARKDAGLPPQEPREPGQPTPEPPAHIVEFSERAKVAYPKPKPMHVELFAFEMFRDELVAGEGALGFGEVLARWEALADRQRSLYEVRAYEKRRAARAVAA